MALFAPIGGAQKRGKVKLGRSASGPGGFLAQQEEDPRLVRREMQKRADRRAHDSIESTLDDIDNLLGMMAGEEPKPRRSSDRGGRSSDQSDGWAAGSIQPSALVTKTTRGASASAGVRPRRRSEAASRAVASAGPRAAAHHAPRPKPERVPAWKDAVVPSPDARPSSHAAVFRPPQRERAARPKSTVTGDQQLFQSQRPRQRPSRGAAAASAGPSRSGAEPLLAADEAPKRRAASAAIRASPQAATATATATAAASALQVDHRDLSMSKLGERVRYAGLEYPHPQLQPGVALWASLTHLPGGVQVVPTLYSTPEGEGLVMLTGGSGQRLVRTPVRSELDLTEGVVGQLAAPQMRERDPVAVVKAASAGAYASTVQLLYSPHELRRALVELLHDSTGPDAADLSPTCIQRYVGGRSTSSSSVARTVYEPGKPPYVWLLSDASSSIADTTRENCYIARVTGNATYAQPKQMALALAKALEKQFRVRFTLFVADFVQDAQEEWWLTQVKAFQHEEPPAPPPRFKTTVPVAPAAARDTAASTAALRKIQALEVAEAFEPPAAKRAPKPAPRGPKLTKCPGAGCRAYFSPDGEDVERLSAADMARCKASRDLEREFGKLPNALELSRRLAVLSPAPQGDEDEVPVCRPCHKAYTKRLQELAEADAKEQRMERRREKHRAQMKAQLQKEREDRHNAQVAELLQPSEPRRKKKKKQKKKMMKEKNKATTTATTTKKKKRPEPVDTSPEKLLMPFDDDDDDDDVDDEDEGEFGSEEERRGPCTVDRGLGRVDEPPKSPWRVAAAAAARILKSPAASWRSPRFLGVDSPKAAAQQAAAASLASPKRVDSPQQLPSRRPPCPPSPVPCSQGCGALVEPGQQPAHERECLALRVLPQSAPCPQGCGASVAAGQLQAHARVCELRAVDCDQGCGRSIPLRALSQHKALACVARVVPCARGCGASLAMRDREAHETRCAGPAGGRVHTIAAPSAEAVLDDVAFKERILSAIREALGRSITLRVVSRLADNGNKQDRCKLLLRTLYRDTRPFCRDQGECPPVELSPSGEEAWIELQPWLLAGK